MTNQQRSDKLAQAAALIREVELSYPEGDHRRATLFQWAAAHLSFLGLIGQLIYRLKEEPDEDTV